MVFPIDFTSVSFSSNPIFGNIFFLIFQSRPSKVTNRYEQLYRLFCGYFFLQYLRDLIMISHSLGDDIDFLL